LFIERLFPNPAPNTDTMNEFRMTNGRFAALRGERNMQGFKANYLHECSATNYQFESYRTAP
jgi:hypothetical protein